MEDMSLTTHLMEEESSLTPIRELDNGGWLNSEDNTVSLESPFKTEKTVVDRDLLIPEL